MRTEDDLPEAPPVTQKEEQPLDTRLLCDAVIELNISRRNVAIYPQGHSSVTKSLDRAFVYLNRIFDLRNQIAIAVARDTLIVDDSYLDKKNPVFREFATSLSGINVVCVNFLKGVTIDELYSFHRLLSVEKRHLDKSTCDLVRQELGLTHIELVPIDYDAFGFVEGRGAAGDDGKDMWVRYVKGLLDGTLRSGDFLEEFRRLPPERVAALLNIAGGGTHEESYDSVISSYLRKSSERWFSSEELKRLMSVIEGLDPGVKKQFLSSSVKMLSRNIGQAEKAMRSISVDKVAEFLTSIEEQNVLLPRSLKSLIERFSELNNEGLKRLGFDKGLVADDFLLSPEIMNLLDEKRYEEHVPQSYRDELHKIMSCNLSELYSGDTEVFRRKWSDEHAEQHYNQIILELLSFKIPTTVTGVGGDVFSGQLKEQLDLFAASGQYDQILNTLVFLTSGSLPRETSGTASEVLTHCGSPAFMATLASSFRAVGRQKREEAARLCAYYGDLIIHPLLEALVEEQTQSGRRFVIGLVTSLGARAVPGARNLLKDERWYVKRNALFILGECGGDETRDVMRAYCRHSDPRVRLEALRHLVKRGDPSGIDILREDLLCGERERALRAASLAATYEVREVVPELSRLLRGHALGPGEHDLKVHLVKALGQIADESAVEALRDLLSSKSIFFRKEHEKLKGEARKAIERISRGEHRGGAEGHED